MQSSCRGEVRLEVPRAVSDATRTSILKAVVNLGGVVSATFESAQLVISTRTAAVSEDPVFVADLRVAVQEHVGKGGGDVIVLDQVRAPFYFDDGESAGESFTDEEPDYLDDSEEDELVYLDDSEEVCEPQCHFFKREHWLHARRLQEHDDDPTIIARLRKARQRMEKRRHEEEVRINRLFSVIMPLRAQARSQVDAVSS